MKLSEQQDLYVVRNSIMATKETITERLTRDCILSELDPWNTVVCLQLISSTTEVDLIV
jgi:hypothetical protein